MLVCTSHSRATIAIASGDHLMERLGLEESSFLCRASLLSNHGEHLLGVLFLLQSALQSLAVQSVEVVFGLLFRAAVLEALRRYLLGLVVLRGAVSRRCDRHLGLREVLLDAVRPSWPRHHRVQTDAAERRWLRSRDASGRWLETG